MRSETIKAIEKEKIIVIVRGVKKADLIPFAEAMYEGGIRLLEITFDANEKVADEETAERIKMLVSHFGNKLLIGAGTVLKESQVELVKNAGGCFIISPDTCESVIKKTRELGLVSIPGALTPTEIMNAHRFGADFVKLFPITNLGADYVKAVKAPLSHVKLLAVGGINEKNIPNYLSAGVSGFGVGGNIVNKELIQSKDFAAITSLAENYVEVVKK